MNKPQAKLGNVLLVLGMNLVIFAVALMVISANEDRVPSFQHMDEFVSFANENLYLVSVDAERKASLKKVTGIISRYNPEMENQLKHSIANEIYAMSKKYPNLDIDFISATITHESAKTWNPNVISKVGARGLMQVMPATGAFLAAEEGINWTSTRDVLHDPIYNIRLGCRYLSQLVSAYEHKGGLAAYNSGPKRAEMWIQSKYNDNILYAETRSYIPAVLKLYAEFQSQNVM